VYTKGAADVEGLLDELDGLQVGGDGSASEVFAQVVVVVDAINQVVVQRDARQAQMFSADIAEKLRQWIDRLIRKLTDVVEKLADGTTFSISIGTGVSVTVNFPPHIGPADAAGT
jgi:hypothetical protein